MKTFQLTYRVGSCRVNFTTKIFLSEMVCESHFFPGMSPFMKFEGWKSVTFLFSLFACDQIRHILQS